MVMKKKQIKTLSGSKLVLKRASVLGFMVMVLFGSALVGAKPDLTIKGVRLLPKEASFGESTSTESLQVSQDISFQKIGFDPTMPVDGYLSQRFSFYHPAVDLAASYNSPVHPIGPGKVVSTGWDPYGKGKNVIVGHEDNLKSLYAHLSKIEVNIGDKVTTNTELGRVGLTGHTTGPHLHLEVYDGTEMVDPENFLPPASASPSSIAAKF